MQHIYKTLLILLGFLVISCGPKKTAAERKADATKENVIEKNLAAKPSFKTMQGRLKGSYDDGEDSQSISVSIRIEKDKAIWLSAKLAGIIPLAKVMVTPKRVQFYEKINGSYFDGDFSLLSKWLGTELDYEKVQNLLIGQPIYELKSKKYILSSSQNGYQLSSIEKTPVARSFLIDLLTFRTKAQQLLREEKNQAVMITYDDFYGRENYDMPKNIIIIANQEDKTTKINIDYRSLAFNEPVSFPFEIPSGYEEIIIE
ncbi:DUF4292 domain-containing protein [Mesonia aestuariivivens]|uniref:DUF4292 domain-containing protein n=1 Tax=Mesonia aestuariivivens TaxID=2796128 RepID=A0ABS6VX66_9FLAO|nr:DUF4292 domain-containing protein [Mesonia aestuariivivens]MBW2960200.1 DUF4292 domain-containing protein [Mesonia aestuariivivens]